MSDSLCQHSSIYQIIRQDAVVSLQIEQRQGKGSSSGVQLPVLLNSLGEVNKSKIVLISRCG